MLSGDKQEAAEAVAAKVGIDRHQVHHFITWHGWWSCNAVWYFKACAVGVVGNIINM
jgi:magnesium-transporting ATPase (P-type)